MNKKKSTFIFTIVVVLLLSPTLKSIKINQRNLSQDINNEKCNCQRLTKKMSKFENNKGLYFGLLEGGENLPEGEKYIGLVPSSLDWRNHEGRDWTTSIKDQGRCGSCYAFGLYSAMESCIKIKKNKSNYFIDLSEQYMVSCGTEWISGIFGCEGAYMSSILKFVEIYGAIPESCFPYKSSNGYLPPCADKCEDWNKYKKEIIGWSSISPSQPSMKNALINFGPLVTGMEIYENFLTYSEGIYEPSGDLLGYHLVSIVGYNDNPGYWICKNSWGTDWGEDGWFRIKYDACEIEKDTIYI
jgi:C1A family cysteine protease